MKRTLILTILAILASTMAFSAVQVGSTINASKNWRWVEIMNPNGIDNGNGHFEFGEVAGIKGGTITVTVIDNDQILCIYTAIEEAFGTCCPTGALFFMNKAEFQQMLVEQEKKVREEKAEKERRAREEKAEAKRLKAKKGHVEALLKKKN